MTIQIIPLSRCSINIKDRSKNVLELPLLIGGTSGRESSANRVFADLFFFFTSSRKYNGADRSTKDISWNYNLINYSLLHLQPM